MPRRYPPLTPEEVIAILLARGFFLDRTAGSHAQYGGTIREQFCRGLTREEFYGSARESARKIGLRADEYPVPLQ